MSSPHRVLLIAKSDFRHERDGGAKRVAAVVRMLEGMGCKVDWVTVRPFATNLPMNGRGGALRVLGRTLATGSVSALKWYSPQVAGVISQAVREGVALAVVEYSQLAPYRAILPSPAVFELHNIEADLLASYAASARGPRRWAARWEERRMRAIEARAGHDFDLVSVVSEHDAATLRAGGCPGRLVVATNGFSEEWFRAEGGHVPDSVVFSAQLGWRPNIDAAIWLVREVWPLVLAERPQAKLTLAGRQPALEVRRLAGNSVTVLADVADMVPVVAGAAVATAPLLAAGGTRLKILEALAAGTPVVATRLGALGLESLAGPHLQIADSPAEFARAIIQAMGADSPREARRELVANYRWSAALAPLETAIRALLGEVSR